MADSHFSRTVVEFEDDFELIFLARQEPLALIKVLTQMPLHGENARRLLGMRITQNYNKNNNVAIRALSRFVCRMKGEVVDRSTRYQLFQKAKSIIFPSVKRGISHKWLNEELELVHFHLIGRFTSPKKSDGKSFRLTTIKKCALSLCCGMETIWSYHHGLLHYPIFYYPHERLIAGLDNKIKGFKSCGLHSTGQNVLSTGQLAHLLSSRLVSKDASRRYQTNWFSIGFCLTCVHPLHGVLVWIKVCQK